VIEEKEEHEEENVEVVVEGVVNEVGYPLEASPITSCTHQQKQFRVLILFMNSSDAERRRPH
jgi:hypothetical protein